jgi:lipoprotein NlpD
MNALEKTSQKTINNMSTLQTIFRRMAIGAILVALGGCAARNPAPVSDARPPAGATSSTSAAPVLSNAATALPGSGVTKPSDPSKVHVIQRGDTMYSVARQYGLDYRELAAWNNIVNPTAIRLGDTLRLTRPDSTAVAATTVSTTPMTTDANNQATPTTNSTTPLTAGEVITTPLMVTPPIVIEKPLINTPAMKVEPKASKLAYTDQAYAKMQAESGAALAPTTAPVTVPATALTTPPSAPITVPTGPAVPAPTVPATPAAVAGMPDWAWPVKGKVLTTFTETTKGIDIAGTRGKPVLAAAAGKVIYNEAGLRGYGRMIIIKHSEQWLSAYAHNEKILVQKDQEIKQGQKIAEMGSSDTDSVKLHFEIRKQGKPVDPMKYLPAQ